MKRILLVAFLMLFISVNAQFNKQNTYITKDEFNDFSTEIIRATGKTFVLSKSEKTDEYNIKYYYVNQNDKGDELILSVFTVLEGITNTAKGYRTYSVRKVSGKFESLFPIWKKYVNPNADSQAVLRTDITESPNDFSVIIYNNNGFDDFWSIRI